MVQLLKTESEFRFSAHPYHLVISLKTATAPTSQGLTEHCKLLQGLEQSHRQLTFTCILVASDDLISLETLFASVELTNARARGEGGSKFHNSCQYARPDSRLIRLPIFTISLHQ